MSVIPKIGVSRPTKRSKSNLSFDCSTSANFGDIQPTMCRVMVPGQSNHVKVHSSVRLASMPLPSFGRLHLKHYHAFVPYSSLWEQMSAYLSQQHYNTGTLRFIPGQIPMFFVRAFWAAIIRKYSYISIVPKDDVNNPLVWDGNMSINENNAKINAVLEFIRQHQRDLLYFGKIKNDSVFSYQSFNSFTSESEFDDSLGGFVFGNWIYRGNLYGSSPITAPWNNFKELNTSLAEGSQYSIGSVGLTGADFSEELMQTDSSGTNLVSSGYILCYKLMPCAKHLRKIVIGLGSQFNPHNIEDEPENIFKLLAYYKTWFEYFRPLREISFTDTNCYKLIKYLSDNQVNDVTVTSNIFLYELFGNFVDDLMNDTYYYLPSDYFSMSTLSPQYGNSDNNTSIDVIIGNDPYDGTSSVNISHDNYIGSVEDSGDGVYPIAVKLAQKLLTFVNKNTVIGRSIREYIRVHYGVFEDQALDSNGIVRLGVSDVNIQIYNVTSTAPSSDGFLGEYAGIGMGKDSSEKFDYTAKEFGCWICLSVVVPQSGYYQGTLPENKYKNRFEWFTPEFDALGYEVLSRSEIMDNYIASSENWSPSRQYEPNDSFGFVPRYSNLKIGRNIVNGDLSIGGMPSKK